ncbi:MAG: 3-hydroxybutyryl-CoA dehydrogenase [Acidobacteria bacterium]|nr:MAG: 3-hydroxybutyryl-CoA dehydrogenase [Acidobacteriota bacterium]
MNGIRRLGVVGCGQMGSGIAEVAALAGIETVAREVSEELWRAGRDRIEASLERAQAKGRIEADAAAAALSRFHGTTELADLAQCDLVIEAVVEDLEVKRQLFGQLDALLEPSGILASNTSSLTLTQLAVCTQRPDRFLGLHFFNPVSAMRLVEVVRTLMTSPETLAAGHEFVHQIGKQAVECKDGSGFVVNRLLVPYLLDAVRALEQNVASMEDIDTGMKLGCGHPMGPFTLLDFIGLDTIVFIADIMFDEYREARYAPPPMLRQLVQAGRLGRKSGRGFYDYGGGSGGSG